MGGECNYLLRVTPDTKRLEFVPDDEWMTPVMKSWEEEVSSSSVMFKSNIP
jgi:IMP and pyridine-specific 5'-nucleotidase